MIDLDKWDEITSVITRNKSRSVLTAFGIFWGIFMWVLLMGGGQGMERMLAVNFNGFATNSCVFFPSRTSKPYKGFQTNRDWNFKLKDVERIQRVVTETEIVTPLVSKWNEKATHGTRKFDIQLRGCYPELTQIQAPIISYGRFLNKMDVQLRRRICVIGSRVTSELFPNISNPVGQNICINHTFYKIIGVNKAEENGGSETVYIPFTTMQEQYNRGNNIDEIYMTVKPGNTIESIVPHVESVLKEANFIAPNDQEALKYVNIEAMFQMVASLFSGISWLVWLIGIGTLVSGAIGVSNIMMITVKERTSEIGIRRAIGAHPRDILTQIILESVLLTVFAGMLGILLAVFVLSFIESSANQAMHMSVSFQISFPLALAAASALALLGILAGLAPAFRALKIKPVDAMREE